MRGRDPGSFVQEVRDRIAGSVVLPAGVFPVWGGQYENHAQALAARVIASPETALMTGRGVLFSGARQLLFELAAAALTSGMGRIIGVSLAG